MRLHTIRVSGSVLTFVLLCAAPCLANRIDSSNSIHKGSTSVQFLAFGDNAFSGPFTSGIFFKTHFSDRGALRVGANFRWDDASGRSPRGSPGLAQVENHRNRAILVSAELNQYVDSHGPVTVYLGLGPYWSRYRDFFEAYRSFTSPYDSTTHTVSNRSERVSWVVGASAAAGFEWFFKRKLSMLGRVGGSAGFGKRRESGDYYYDSPPPGYQPARFNYNIAGAATSSAALGLSVYF